MWILFGVRQLLLKSKTRYFPAGRIVAEGRGKANGLMVITSGKVSTPPTAPAERDSERGSERQRNGETEV